MEHRNVVVEKSIDFAAEIVRFCEILEGQKKWVIAKQLLRCGTSIGANVFEAQQAESRADFIHKMKLALKEAEETRYWLILCDRCEHLPSDSSLKQKAEELIRIISTIIISSRHGTGKRISS